MKDLTIILISLFVFSTFMTASLGLMNAKTDDLNHGPTTSVELCDPVCE